MTREEIETQLVRLGKSWPARSVADAVTARLDSCPALPRPAVPRVRRAKVLIAAAVVLLVSATASWLLLATPRTLQAQVQQAIKKAGTARIVIAMTDDKGIKQRAEIWYSREKGFRAESSDELLVDDGEYQWSWRPDAEGADAIVSRRESRDAMEMISGMFQLQNAPADWAKKPAAEHDREVSGVSCRAFLVEPPGQMVVAKDGTGLLPDPNPSRILLLVDLEQRIVRLETQRKADGKWVPGREVSIEYGVDVPAEKFAADFPRGAKVIDADRVLEKRFPLETAVARVESAGLLFAVHEAARSEEGSFYFVTSVRGTPEHLDKYPPVARRINLQMTLLDVAEQIGSAHVDNGLSRAVLATAESDGVHYVWWLALRRHYFRLEDGKRKSHSDSPSLERKPGEIRVPLMGRHRDTRVDTNWVNAAADVPLPVELPIKTWAELAARARRDALMISQGAGPIAWVYDVRADSSMAPTEPARMSDTACAESLVRQIDWLRDQDEIIPMPDR